MIKRLFDIIPVAMLLMCVSHNAAAKTSPDTVARVSTYLGQGQYVLAWREASSVLEEAESKAEQSQAYGLLGNIQLQMHRYREAETSLLKAFELADDPLQKADYANSLGVLYHENGYSDQQDQYFKTALQFAGTNAPLSLKIKLNRLKTQTGTEVLTQAIPLLTEITKLDSPNVRAHYAINLAAAVNKQGVQGLSLAQEALEKAQADSANINDRHLRVDLLDSLSEIYETQGQDQRALDLCEQASELTEQMNGDEGAASLEWRKGRIYQKQGKDDFALAAFGKAVDNIQAIRQDIPVEYHDGKSSFRETLEPVYLGYAFQLLKKAGHQEGEAKQRTLLLARNTVEQIKQTEMEDFFGARCLIEGLQRSELETLDTHAAVLYPIMLPDRLELLVSIGKTIRQFTVPVPQSRIREEAGKLSDSLRNGKKAFREPSQNLYQWLIAPLEKDLAGEDIKTLVVVPDGALRLVPFSALFDGQHYVVEKYAVSVSPGMSLMGHGGDAKSRTYRTLLAGLSKPGPVVGKLPSPMVSALLEPESESSGNRKLPATRGLANGATSATNALETSAKADILLRQPGAEEKLKEKLSLPAVEDELSNLQKTVTHTTLLNDQFTVDSFHRQVAGEEPYEMVHIASHGIFSSNANNSFLMAYDNVIKLDDLETLLKQDKGAQRGIELLTLSACETAEGDDRAPLGFTGAALRARARSALGSLWPIADQAASQLMTNFYANMTQSLGKAEALRQAQLKLLNDPKMSHPFYWSPFILVGNWL
ncbi:MAG: CHAT domain-containing protein [Methylococcaceae bacterium]|nr:CHAT domain-containing protein [Methylococcaceae bacterium]